MLLPLTVDLRERVHREAAGPFEPDLVARAGEKRKEGQTVSCGPVTEARSFHERTGVPRELAARQKEGVQLRLTR